MRTVVLENNDVKKEIKVGSVTTNGIKENPYKQGFYQVEIRQVINEVSSYPSQRVNTGMGDSLFDSSEFDIQKGESYDNKSTRVAWLDVPFTATEETVKQLLTKLPKAGIVRVIRHSPILTQNEHNAIAAGLNITVEGKAMSQLIRDPKEGTPVLYNGLPQYQRSYFVKEMDPENHKLDERNSSKVYYCEDVKHLQDATILDSNQIV